MAKGMNYSKIRRRIPENELVRPKTVQKVWAGPKKQKKSAQTYRPTVKNVDVKIFTDGSCLKNPGGAGGWAAIIWIGDEAKELYGCEAISTNNRMELMGPIIALESLLKPSRVLILSDSQYVVKGASNWISGWKKKGWITAEKQPVKNKDLWERIDAMQMRHQVFWEWVRGHNGHEQNERCDELAGRAAREQISQ